MQKEQLLSRVTGSLVRHISAKALQTVKIPVPPREQQDEFEQFIKSIDISKTEINESLIRLSDVYKAVIAEKFSK